MAIEDFTTYTEVDPDGRITITATRCTKVSEPANEDATWVYDDKGIGHFGDFEHLFTMECTASDDDGYTVYWGVGNVLQGWSPAWHANAELIVVIFDLTGAGTNKRVGIRGCEGQTSDTYIGALNTPYYCTVERSGTTFTNKIYLDEARTNLDDTLSMVCSSTTMKYILAHDCSAGTGTDTQSGYTEYLDLQEDVEVSAGIKIWDGTSYIELVKNNTSPVRIWTGSEAIGVKLVNPNHANASAIQIFDGTTIKAFKKKV